LRLRLRLRLLRGCCGRKPPSYLSLGRACRAVAVGCGSWLAREGWGERMCLLWRQRRSNLRAARTAPGGSRAHHGCSLGHQLCRRWRWLRTASSRASERLGLSGQGGGHNRGSSSSEAGARDAGAVRCAVLLSCLLLALIVLIVLRGFLAARRVNTVACRTARPIGNSASLSHSWTRSERRGSRDGNRCGRGCGRRRPSRRRSRPSLARRWHRRSLADCWHRRRTWSRGCCHR
jgi:hypothetical protein